MAIKIIRATDAIKVETLRVLIYGQPGLGKTSLAFTCDKPLCLDFDKGAYRSKQRKDSLDIQSWDDIVELMRTPAVFGGYKTIVVDTIGRCLDSITQHVLNGSPKSGNSKGGLTMQGWGELKNTFQTWVRQLTLLGLDVVFVAHDKEDKDGDRVFKRPDVQGGSYAEVMKTADLIGYMSMRNNKAVLDFTPCDDFIAKNGAGFNPVALPDFGKEMSFGAELLETAKAMMSSAAVSDAETAALVDEWRSAIDACESVEECNGVLHDIGKLKGAAAVQVKKLLNDRRTALGFEYDAKAKTFYAKEVAA